MRFLAGDCEAVHLLVRFVCTAFGTGRGFSVCPPLIWQELRKKKLGKGLVAQIVIDLCGLSLAVLSVLPMGIGELQRTSGIEGINATILHRNVIEMLRMDWEQRELVGYFKKGFLKV